MTKPRHALAWLIGLWMCLVAPAAIAAVSGATWIAQFTGNGTTTQFAFSAQLGGAGDLQVSVTDETGTITAGVLNGSGTYDFTLSGAVDAATGEYLSGATVTFNTAPPANWTVTLARYPGALQTLVLQPGGKLGMKSLEAALDRATLRTQEIQGYFDKSALHTRWQEPAGINLILPLVPQRAGKLLGFDPGGNVEMFDAVTSYTPPLARAGAVVNISKTGADVAGCGAAQGSGACLTIGYALGQALALDVGNSSVTLQLGAGTWSENVTVNGPLRGGTSPTGFTGIATMPLVKIVGAGSASTTIAGGQTVAGASYCYAVLANGGAQVSLQGMTVTANAGGSTCNQSDLYAQFFGTVYIVADVKLGASNGYAVFAEEFGMIQVAAGCGSCSGALTFAASGIGAVGLSTNSVFQSDSTLVFTGTPAYSQQVFLAEGNSTVKLLANPPTSGSFTGTLFSLLSNSVFINYNSETWPGSYGLVASGGIWQNAPPPSVGSLTLAGLGSTPTVVTTGDAYHGLVTMTPGGSGIAATGTFQITLPYAIDNGYCTISPTGDGTGSWQLGSVFQISGNTLSPTIRWSNGGATALTSGQTYPLAYVCH